MERRHQVFVSSTYADLIEERKQVIHALLELECIPAGMELFPATDEDAWSLIEGVIDDSDYYVLIIAGRYGSIDSEGLSFTEREYDYARKCKKPIIAFLHHDTGSIRSDNSEVSEDGRQKLEAFIKKVKSKHIKTYTSPEDLGGKVSRSLVQLRRKHPSPGWVPGKYAADEAMLRKIETLRSRVAELEQQSSIEATPPSGTEDFARGEDLFILTSYLISDDSNERKEYDLKASWDEILGYVGPTLLGECNEEELEQRLRLLFWHKVPSSLQDLNSFENIIIPYVVFDRIKVQLQALGLIIPGTRKRTASDINTYWKLTKYGQNYLIRLRAIRRRGKQVPIIEENEKELKKVNV